MAAVSHLKNRREAKTRFSVDKIINQCSSGSKVSLKSYLELLKGAGVALEEKEASKLEAMSDRSGNIDRMDFMVYAKKSSIFKILTDGERQQTQDKAEIAFKAVDKDNSGYISVGELGMLGGGKLDHTKTEALMDKLDTDKDGRISLDEFRKLFKEK